MNMIRLRTLFRTGGAILAGAALFAAAGCGDDSTSPPSTFDPPSGLTFENGEGEITLRWNGSPDESFDEFIGYNVYRDTQSMVGLDSGELASRVLNANVLSKTTRTYVDRTAQAGTKYFYAIRGVRDNGDVTSGSGEIDTAPVLGGNTISEISEFADPTGASGMDLSEGQVYSVRAENAVHIDFYLGTTALDDASSAPLMIKSPNLVDSTNPAWDTRIASFKLLPADAWTTTPSGFSDSIELGSTPGQVEDKIIAVKLPVDENGEVHYGKIEILELNGSAGQRSIRFVWTYQPVAGYIRF